MARPKKEEKLKHKNYITLKLTDIELACLEQSAEALNISRVEYLRNLILEKPMIYKYEVVADNEQLKKLKGNSKKVLLPRIIISYMYSLWESPPFPWHYLRGEVLPIIDTYTVIIHRLRSMMLNSSLLSYIIKKRWYINEKNNT